MMWASTDKVRCRACWPPAASSLRRASPHASAGTALTASTSATPAVMAASHLAVVVASHPAGLIAARRSTPTAEQTCSWICVVAASTLRVEMENCSSTAPNWLTQQQHPGHPRAIYLGPHARMLGDPWTRQLGERRTGAHPKECMSSSVGVVTSCRSCSRQTPVR